MIRVTQSPFVRGILQAAVVLGGFVVLAFSGIVDCGETASDLLLGRDPSVTGLVFSPAPPYENDISQPVIFAVTAVDDFGTPVRDSQGGITISTPLPFTQTDVPDPDNARIQVTVRPNEAFSEGQMIVFYASASIQKSFTIRFTHQATRLVVNPAGPLILLLNESIPVTITALDASGGTVPGADRVIEVSDPDVTLVSWADFIPDPGEPSGDGVLRGRVVAKRRLGDGTGDVLFTMRNPTLTAQLDLTITEQPAAPAGRVVSVRSAETMHVGLTIVLLARVRDLTTGALVAGSDPFVTARSSNEAVATVVSKSEGVPNDGEVEFTIRGNSVGTAVISFSYPGSTDDTTLLTVNPSVHPTLAEIAPRNYIFRKQSTVLGCSGTVTQSNDPATATNVGGVNPLRLQTFFTAPPPSGATTSTVQGPYNDADGTYIANGTDDFGNVHELNGHWTEEPNGDPRFDGTLVERKFSPTCENIHSGVTYTVN